VKRIRIEDAARALVDAGFGDYVVWSDGARASLAAGVRARLTVEDQTVTVRDASDRLLAEATTGEPFSDARRLLGRVVPAPFRAWGYLGFGLAAFKYPYARNAGTSMHLVVPEVTCTEHDGELVVTGEERAVERARTALAAFVPRPSQSAALGNPAAIEAAVRSGRDAYEGAVRIALDAIRAHQVEKVILSRRVVLPARLDALATFQASEKTQAARRFAFALGGVGGVGACPEILLVADAAGHVVTNPLAGTQPRGPSEEEDARLCANLLRDAKEVSEHAMSIRLAYEEIAGVCTAESTRVIDFMQVKRYPFTQHLSSRAAGTLSPGRTTWDALQAVFPGVTVTGIAKRDAIALIDRLETAPRGVYGGAVGWVDDTGAMDWGIAIRSVFDYGEGATLNAGAGIVVDSEAGYEFDESAHKMQTMASRVVLALPSR
jgi:salicylate synthetase